MSNNSAKNNVINLHYTTIRFSDLNTINNRMEILIQQSLFGITSFYSYYKKVVHGFNP